MKSFIVVEVYWCRRMIKTSSRERLMNPEGFFGDSREQKLLNVFGKEKRALLRHNEPLNEITKGDIRRWETYRRRARLE